MTKIGSRKTWTGAPNARDRRREDTPNGRRPQRVDAGRSVADDEADVTLPINPSGAIEEKRSQPDRVRTQVLEQLGYLVDEIDALKRVIDRVPEPVLTGRPTGSELSIKELYGIIALADEQVFPTYIESMVDGVQPDLSVPDDEALAREEAWQEEPIEAILQRVRRSRQLLVQALRALPKEAWKQQATAGDARLDLYGLARYVVQRDTTILRIVGMRLHESRLTERAQDLPK